ncbi:MAG: DUF4157 domain-containing protein [Bryobacteraceae bacterium]|nr:DUF4157 domain-containing protein [Bryobacteraceae bacterium]
MPGPTQTTELKTEVPKPAPAPEEEQLQSGAASGVPAWAERRTTAGSRLPLFLSGGTLPVDEPGSALEQEADRVADRASPDGRGAPSAGSPSDSGDPVDPRLQRAFAPVLGTTLGGVRVHAGPVSRQSADNLGARAFTRGQDIFLGSHQSAGDARLIAHEAAHTVQQSRGGFYGIQRQPVAQSAPQGAPVATAELTPEAVALFTPDALTHEEDKLLTELATAAVGSRDTLEKKLGVVQNEMAKRTMPVKPYWGMRTAVKPEDKASAGQIAALQARMDLLIVLLQTAFPASASEAVTRLTGERTRLDSLHKDDVLREGDKLEAAQAALEAIGRMNRGLPATAPIGLETQYGAVRKAIVAAVTDVATVRQNGRLAAAQAAGEKYLDAFSGSMIQKTRDMKAQLKGLPEGYNEANGFINGYARNNQILVGGSFNEVSTYNFRREFTLRELDSLGDLEKMQAASFADRVNFLDKNGETLTNALLRGQALSLMNAGFQAGMALMDAVTNATEQAVASDVFVAQRIRRGVIVPLAAAVDGKVTDTVLAKAQSVLVQEEASVRARITDVNEYLQRVGTFVQVAAIVLSLYGGMAAMEAAGGSGVTISATGSTQIALGQFVRGSLAFTMASSMITSGITGQPITPQGFALQAGMDMATLGLMHIVGAGFAAHYGGPANIPLGLQATAQFTALWAWSAANAFVAQPGPITAGSAAKTIAETGQHTALAMLAMGVAHRMATLPALAKPPATDPAIAARQSAAIAEFEQVRARPGTGDGVQPLDRIRPGTDRTGTVDAFLGELVRVVSQQAPRPDRRRHH